MIIAIDGPAASGKGTLARRLAEHYGLPHLDTGLLYRATARALPTPSRVAYNHSAIRIAGSIAGRPACPSTARTAAYSGPR